MKILSITAGAAAMYCGSCLRDNALAGELRRQGHQLTLAPVYTPTLTDEENQSGGHVLFGGISVYLQQHSRFFRHTPELLDRLWDSRLALRLASKRSIPVDPRLLGELTVSMLEGEQGVLRKEFRKLREWLAHEEPPDVVTLPNALLIALAPAMKQVLGRPVAVTFQGEDLFLDRLIEPYRSRSMELIGAHVGSVDAFIAVSGFYGDYMAGYFGIGRDRVHVTPLGISFEGYAAEPAARTPGEPLTIGYFARIAPEKGLHLLAEAYRKLRSRPDVPALRLDAAGYLGAEYQPYLRGIEAAMREAGLEGEFRYHGAMDREQKLRFLAGLDLLAAPAVYDEPKGIYALEALASGVPVVAPRRGVFPEMLERTGGGVLIEPDSAEALADGMLALIRDRESARQLGDAGAQGVRRHYTLVRMAEATVNVYRGMLEEAGDRSAVAR